MATVNLYVRPEMKDNKGHLPIYLIFQDRGKKFKHFTGYKIPSLYWDHKKQEIYEEYPEASMINEEIKGQQERLFHIWRELKDKGQEAELDDIRNSFRMMNGTKIRSSDFFNFFEEFLEMSRVSKQGSTVAIYQALLKDLKRFETQTGFELSFQRIDAEFYEKFTEFLVEKLNNTNNTVSKKIKSLKAFLNYASGKKLIDPSTYRSFKTTTISPFKVILSEAELSKIFNLNLSLRPELAEIRDLFLFGCFTGMKYSEIQKLTPNDVQGGKIKVYNYFTKQILSIPLNNYAQMILRRYEDRRRTNCFPQIANVYANKFVKEIAAIAKIDSETFFEIHKGKEVIRQSKPKYHLVTTDTARFTFAALSLKSGMRPEVLILILGQKNINSLMQYVIDHNPVQDIEILNCWNKKVF